MKNKLLLLLFLLMPSLCFAETLRIQSVVNEKVPEIAVIRFTWSNNPLRHYDIPFNRQGIDNYQINAKDNKDNLKVFRSVVKKFFLLSHTVHSENAIWNREKFDVFEIMSELENWAVWDNYAVTFKEISSDGGSGTQALFLSRPDDFSRDE
jgi:hypothetical protein